jgi:hypothetical protein
MAGIKRWQGDFPTHLSLVSRLLRIWLLGVSCCLHDIEGDFDLHLNGETQGSCTQEAMESMQQIASDVGCDTLTYNEETSTSIY